MLTVPIGFVKVDSGVDPELLKFKFKIVTSSPSESFKFPAAGAGGEIYEDAIINFGDGSGDKTVLGTSDSNLTNIYSSPGTYECYLSGKWGGFSFGNGPSRLYITEVTQWGNVGFEYLRFAFWGCSNLTHIYANDADFTDIASLSRFAEDCTSLVVFEASNIILTGVEEMDFFVINCELLQVLDVSNWDMSTVRLLNSFAAGCTELVHLYTASWTLPAVTALDKFANECINLETLEVQNWDVSRVVNITRFARLCGKLVTLNTGNWDTSSLDDVRNAFQSCLLLTSSFDNTLWWDRPIPISLTTAAFFLDTNVPEYSIIPAAWGGGGA